ncbi:MAG TPA: diguanylate cyclase, partial [Gemmatimonadales bacterium]|nr:diguanylate cyclase [Gemmatimonadales bacterium]
SANPAADAVLLTLNDITEPSLGHLLTSGAGEVEPRPPCIVIIAASDRDAPAAVLELGAQDALSAPIHLPELCARLHLHIRARHRSGHSGQERTPSAASNGRRSAESPGVGTGSEQDTLDRRVREEFERARRYSLSFSLILLGVDELDRVREREGSEAAERLKRDVAGALRRELRLPDFVAGYGPNEFAIVLPETGPTGARQSVLRVRERLALVPSTGDPRLEHPRFSAGIVTYPHPAVSQSDELYAMLEAALMRGKAQTGERIGVAV